MAETGNQILYKILGVLSEMDKKLAPPTPTAPGATTGTAPETGKTAKGDISSVIKQLINPKLDYKRASSNIRELAVALKTLSEVKFNIFNKMALQGTLSSLKELVKFAIYVGKNEEKVKKGSEALKDLSKSITRIATAIPKFLGLLALSMIGFVFALYVIGRILAVNPAMAAIAFGATLAVIFGIFWTVGKAKDSIEAGTEVMDKMGKSIMYLAGGMVLFAIAVALIPRILGVGQRAKNQGDNAITAAYGVAIIAGSLLLISLAFWGLGKFNDKITKGTDIAKGMGEGILYLAGGMVLFAVAVALIPRILGVGARNENRETNKTTAIYGVAIIIGGIIGFAFLYILMGKLEPHIKKGTSVAVDMAIGMMALSGAMVIFALTVALVPRILGVGARNENKESNKETAALGAKIIMGTIIAFAIGFGILGLAEKQVKKGAIVAMFIAGAIALLSIAVFMFATTAKAITAMSDTSATKTVTTLNADGTVKSQEEKKRSKFGQLFAGIGPGLGAMGIIIVAGAVLMAILGIPAVALLVGLGAAVAIGVSFALITMAKAIKTVAEVTKGITGEQISNTIAIATSSVIVGVTKGISAGFAGKIAKPGEAAVRGKIDFKEFKQTKRAMRMIGSIAESISKFGEGLRAFESKGKIGKVTFTNEYIGIDPDTHEKMYRTKVSMNKSDAVNVTDVAANIGFALSSFITAITKTDDSLAQKRKLRRLRRGIGGGEDSIMQPLIDFSTMMNSFSEMSVTGNMPVLNAEGQVVMDGTGTNAKPKTYNLKETATKVAAAFATFTSTLSDKLPDNLWIKNLGIGKFGDLSIAISELVSNQEGLDKMANSMGVLATNIGLLSTNLKSLDVTNLTRAAIVAGEYQKRYGSVGITSTPNTIAANTTGTSVTQTEVKFSEDEMRKLAQLIGDQISNSFKNKPFQFKFASGESMAGVIQ